MIKIAVFLPSGYLPKGRRIVRPFLEISDFSGKIMNNFWNKGQRKQKK